MPTPEARIGGGAPEREGQKIGQMEKLCGPKRPLITPSFTRTPAPCSLFPKASAFFFFFAKGDTHVGPS